MDERVDQMRDLLQRVVTEGASASTGMSLRDVLVAARSRWRPKTPSPLDSFDSTLAMQQVERLVDEGQFEFTTAWRVKPVCSGGTAPA